MLLISNLFEVTTHEWKLTKSLAYCLAVFCSGVLSVPALSDLCCHASEGWHLVHIKNQVFNTADQDKFWMPAFAGMT